MHSTDKSFEYLEKFWKFCVFLAKEILSVAELFKNSNVYDILEYIAQNFKITLHNYWTIRITFSLTAGNSLEKKPGKIVFLEEKGMFLVEIKRASCTGIILLQYQSELHGYKTTQSTTFSHSAISKIEKASAFSERSNI